jgi:hypothetical protein
LFVLRLLCRELFARGSARSVAGPQVGPVSGRRQTSDMLLAALHCVPTAQSPRPPRPPPLLQLHNSQLHVRRQRRSNSSYEPRSNCSSCGGGGPSAHSLLASKGDGRFWVKRAQSACKSGTFSRSRWKKAGNHLLTQWLMAVAIVERPTPASLVARPSRPACFVSACSSANPSRSQQIAANRPQDRNKIQASQSGQCTLTSQHFSLSPFSL